MAKNAISRELYNSLVAKGMIKPAARASVATDLRTRNCKNKRLAAALAQVAEHKSTLELPLTFQLYWPPSLNAIWASTKHRETGAIIRVLTAKAKAWRAKALLELRVFFSGAGFAYQGPLAIELAFHGRFTHANGTMRIVDLSNRVKLLEDTVASALHYDDCRHWRVLLTKEPDQREYVQVTLSAVSPDAPSEPAES